MTIIAVDDERLALALLSSSIKEVAPDADLHTFSVADGAVRFAAENRVDVAFLDIEMARVSGIALAKQLKEANPAVNIVFVTGHAQYMRDGFALWASGYVLKPVSPDAIRTELENLRNPIKREEPPAEQKRIRIQTFGNFDVFVDGKALNFERRQAKEIFAILVDKRGTSVTHAELASILWDDDEEYGRSRQKSFHVYVASMIETLRSAGIEDVVERTRKTLMLRTEMVDCDLYRFLAGDVAAINSYTGQYMSAYSWAEFTAGYLDCVRF